MIKKKVKLLQLFCVVFFKSGNEKSQSGFTESSDTSKQEGDSESDYQQSAEESSSDEVSEGDLAEDSDDDNDLEDYPPESTQRKVFLFE